MSTGAAVDGWLPELRPGSSDPGLDAVRWAGEVVNYRDFAAQVTQRARTRSGIETTADAAGGTRGDTASVPRQLVEVFAAAAARRPVRIADPAVPIPADTDLPGDAFLVVGTSGSTQAPRAVVRTAGSWTRSFAGYSAVTGITARDRVLLTGPLHSTMQLFAAVHALASGAVVTDDPADASTAVCVPTVLARLLAAPAPTLRSVVVAGAALPDGLARQAVSHGLTVIEYYGAAELSFVTTRRWPAPHTPFPGVDVQLRDGELWSRSAYRALGHLTARGMVPLPVDQDAYASVGDRAVVADGGLRIVGRGNTAVTVGGRTVSVEEVEAALTGLDSVSDAAVVGAPHPRFGEQLVAMVVPAQGADVAEIRTAARRVLRGEFLPRRWLPVPQVFRRPNGKIDRAAVRRALPENLGGL